MILLLWYVLVVLGRGVERVRLFADDKAVRVVGRR